MSKIWFCPTCGYEVGARGRCHLCRQKLVASPLPPLPAGDEDDEVGYRIADWADRARGRLIEALIEQRILHRFEDDDLVVGAEDEEQVDQMVEEFAEEFAGDDRMVPGTGPATEAPYAGEVEGEVVVAVEMMFRAAQRLRVDPTDMEADGDVAEASAGVFMTEVYPGMAPDEWAAVGRVTRGLLAALGADEALEDEIRRQAAVLVTLLRPAVEATAVDAAPTAGDLQPEADPVALAGEADALVAASALESGADRDAGEEHDADADGASDAEGASDADADADMDSDTDTDSDTDLRILGGGPETSYEVPEWLPEQRALLSVLLEDRAIPHAWDGADLVVPSVDEASVEGLFDQVGGVAEEEDDETRYRALEELFAAVVRLVNDPHDKERSAAVIAASGAVEGPTPIGFDDGKWLGLRRRTRTLADALEHNADPEVVTSQSASLRDSLRELV